MVSARAKLPAAAEEAHARESQDQRGHHRQRPAADQEHAIADPVRQGRKG